jgi:prevent-host-death family protein
VDVPVTELKAHLAKYLRVVRNGGEVQILDRGVPVARLVASPGGRAADKRLSRLSKLGFVRVGNGNLMDVVGAPPKVEGLQAALDEDRADRL